MSLDDLVDDLRADRKRRAQSLRASVWSFLTNGRRAQAAADELVEQAKLDAHVESSAGPFARDGDPVELGGRSWFQRFEMDVELAALEYGQGTTVLAILRALRHGFPTSRSIGALGTVVEGLVRDFIDREHPCTSGSLLPTFDARAPEPDARASQRERSKS